jgi:hypothetical protein
MFLVVPAKESLRESATILKAAETIWELRLRSPALRSAPAPAPADTTPKELPFISSFLFLALLIN